MAFSPTLSPRMPDAAKPCSSNARPAIRSSRGTASWAASQGLIGRKTASVEDFIYSPAMRRANVTWTPETLDAYLKDRRRHPFRGNRMPFAGIPDAQARADLIAYLQAASR